MVFLLFLQKYWKIIAGVIAILAIVGTVYYNGYRNGAAACKEAWHAAEVSRIEAINKRVDEIKTTSDTIAEKQAEATKKVTQNLDAIIAKLKVKPAVPTNVYTTIKDCKPSDTYVETWNDISKKANSK